MCVCVGTLRGGVVLCSVGEVLWWCVGEMGIGMLLESFALFLGFFPQHSATIFGVLKIRLVHLFSLKLLDAQASI